MKTSSPGASSAPAAAGCADAEPVPEPAASAAPAVPADSTAAATAAAARAADAANTRGIAPARPLRFRLLERDPRRTLDARHDEDLIGLAARSGPVACVWEAAQGLVVPRTYRRHEGFEAVRERHARRGWPVTVRMSGGGVVPQGPGILNLSLAYACDAPPLRHSDAAYALLCAVLCKALLGFGIEARPQAVEGSFCDGRYNLACGPSAAPRKVAGTAQLWRRVRADGVDVQVVLAHALLLATTDTAALTRKANVLERALGSGKRYDPRCVAPLYGFLPPDSNIAPADFLRELGDALRRAAAAAEAPGVSGNYR